MAENLLLYSSVLFSILLRSSLFFSIFSIFANLLHQKKEIEEDIDIRVYPAANYQRPASDRKPVNITKVSEEDYLLKYLLTEEDYL